MVQAVRPQDASGVYQRNVGAASEADATSATRARGTTLAAGPPSEASPSRRSDAVALSTQARTLVRARQAAADSAEVLEERVAELRRQVVDGTYRPDARAVAAALVEAAGDVGA